MGVWLLHRFIGRIKLDTNKMQNQYSTWHMFSGDRQLNSILKPAERQAGQTPFGSFRQKLSEALDLSMTTS